MAFVKEILTKEELEKNKIEFDDGWYVNKECNAIFYYDYGNGRGPEKVFRLIWKDKTIMVGAAQHCLGDSVDNVSDEWRRVSFYPEGVNSIEDGLKKLTFEDQKFIRQLIIEALTAFSKNFFNNKKVSVIFDSRMGFNEGKGIGRWH